VIQSIDPDQDMQIAEGLESLKNFVKDVYDEEQAGKTFTAEEADLLGAEAQNRATAITGQIVQVASQLNITIEE
ncbi:MAG: EfeM/EfeO family lipoprotein, partial [Trueperaceae bacterium]